MASDTDGSQVVHRTSRLGTCRVAAAEIDAAIAAGRTGDHRVWMTEIAGHPNSCALCWPSTPLDEIAALARMVEPARLPPVEPGESEQIRRLRQRYGEEFIAAMRAGRGWGY